MRITRMRVATAGVLGLAMIAVASPARATTPTPTATSTATPAVETTTTATATPDATGTPEATGTPSATATPETTGSPTAGVPVEGTPTSTPTPTASRTSGTGDALLDGFLSLLPFKVPLDRQINSITDFDINPLSLSFTCGSNGTNWKMVNHDPQHSYGFGWFDVDLGGGLSEIGPGATLDLPSHAFAVIAAPWNGETKELLVTVPTVGVSDCEGAGPAAAPVVLPVAPPAGAASVSAQPHYTG